MDLCVSVAIYGLVLVYSPAPVCHILYFLKYTGALFKESIVELPEQ